MKQASTRQRCAPRHAPRSVRQTHAGQGRDSFHSKKSQGSAHERLERESDQKQASVGTRINKCFSSSLSRRASDRLVEAGRVTINEAVAVPGAMVHPGDRVALDGEPVAWEAGIVVDSAKPLQQQHTYIKYWKPRGVVCTTDPAVCGNVVDAVRAPCRVFMVGRLDKDSTGLLLLTSDGRLVNALLRSERNHRKVYAVTVDRPLLPRDVRQLAEGVVITTQVQKDRGDAFVTAATLPCTVTQTGVRTFRIELVEGRNRQIRRMCEALGYDVVSLHRESVSGITLNGLSEGRWSVLDEQEMAVVQAVLSEAGERA